MAQDQWTLQEKEKESKPAHGPPLQARVVAANRTVRTTVASILAHMDMDRWGQSKMNGGKLMLRAVGMAWQRRAGTQSRQNKAAAGEHSRRTIRPAQALKHSCRRSGPYRPRSKTTAGRRRWPASRHAVQVGGGSAVVLATRKAGSDLPTCPPPTYRLCLSLSIPTPLICKIQFSPNLFFWFLLFILPHYKFVP